MANFVRHQAAKHETGVMVEIKPYFPPRTLGQNDYFHAMTRHVAGQLGVSFIRMRESFKQEFLTLQDSVVRPGDKIVPSTTSLSKQEFSDFIERCLAWAAEQGVYVPGPEELARNGA
jgi:hypothetical protein